MGIALNLGETEAESALCAFSYRFMCGFAHRWKKQCNSSRALHILRVVLQQRGNDGCGIATALPSHSLLPGCCSALPAVKSVLSFWEHAKSTKTNIDSQNAFSAEWQRALEADKPQINAWNQLQRTRRYQKNKSPTRRPARKTACACLCEHLNPWFT